MKYPFSIFFLFLIQMCYCQDTLFQKIEHAFYYIDMPYEFVDAPLNKEHKLKVETVRYRLDIEKSTNEYSYQIYYDINGIAYEKREWNDRFYPRYYEYIDGYPDTMKYVMNEFSKPSSITRIYPSGKIKLNKYHYDSLCPVTYTDIYIQDIHTKREKYFYDSNGMLIFSGNDTDYTGFVYNDKDIKEIYQYRNSKKKILATYLYNKKSKSRSRIIIHQNKDFINEKIFYDNKGNIGIRCLYAIKSIKGKKINLTHKMVYDWDKDNNLIQLTTYFIEGSLISEKWIAKFKYNSQNLVSKRETYDQWGNLVGYNHYQYEFYD